MRYTHFEIKNFKGIKHIRLNLERTPKGKIFTLVGLNESGKTTVLQAINLLSHRERLDPLRLPGYVEEDVHNLIPIAQRSNFNSTISITAGVALDDVDENRIAKELKQKGLKLSQPIGRFEITQQYTFEKSRLIPDQPEFIWDLELKGRTGSQRSPHVIGDESEHWQQAVESITKFLPRILYFPNFLFEFPDRIYLQDAPVDDDKHKFYRTILQDVLDSIGEGTNLKDHVLSRARSNENFDKKSLDSVLLKMSNHITQAVFSNWDKIFHRPPGKKEIVVSIGNDSPTGPWYLKVALKEGDELYEISERSLGFRWFFTYLLLTQYRGFRKSGGSNVLFLLDEPASNLHSSAQTQLLDSFANLPGEYGLIYTTHSHYMIKPEWLEGAFVVRNEGMTYSSGEEQDYSSRNTVINLTPYREFAASHPDQSTYFQPILDVLDYQPGRLENIPNVVMFEGKNDFYTINFMQRHLNLPFLLNLLPGGGAGSLDAVIQLYLGWGRNFIVLLDSGQEGELQKKRYSEIFGPAVEGRIYILSDIDSQLTGKSMEFLFTESDRLKIQQSAYSSALEFNKTHFNRALQELFLTDRKIVLSEQTNAIFTAILQWCSDKVAELDK